MIYKNPLLPLKSARLTLRPFVISDFDSYAAYHSIPDVYRYLYCAAPAGDALQKQFDDILVAPFADDGDVFRLAVVCNDDHALIGEVLLKLANQSALQGEVGYIFNPVFSGKAFATEAVAAILNLGFLKMGFHRIFARLDTKNRGSVGVVERLGFRCEAHLIENDRFEGVWGDEYIYGLLASEWQARVIGSEP